MHRGWPWGAGDRIGELGPSSCAMASLMARHGWCVAASCRQRRIAADQLGRQALGVGDGDRSWLRGWGYGIDQAVAARGSPRLSAGERELVA